MWCLSWGWRCRWLHWGLTPSEGGSIEISFLFTPETGVGRHILHQHVECRGRETHDRTVLLIITTHEMFALPRLWLRFDKVRHDVIHWHL
jgi:hypothetical protein